MTLIVVTACCSLWLDTRQVLTHYSLPLFPSCSGEFYLGYAKSEIQGRSWYELVHWEYLKEAQSKHRLISQSEQERSCILLMKILTRSGTSLWVHVVLQVKDSSESSQQPVIVCTNQILRLVLFIFNPDQGLTFYFLAVKKKLQLWKAILGCTSFIPSIPRCISDWDTKAVLVLVRTFHPQLLGRPTGQGHRLLLKHHCHHCIQCTLIIRTIHFITMVSHLCTDHRHIILIHYSIHHKQPFPTQFLFRAGQLLRGPNQILVITTTKPLSKVTLPFHSFLPQLLSFVFANDKQYEARKKKLVPEESNSLSNAPLGERKNFALHPLVGS